MAAEIRTLSEGEINAYRASLMETFGGDSDDDPAGEQRLRALIDLNQAWAAFDGGNIVATAATFELQIGLPGGGSVPMSGLTMVTVRPTHRRRGLLRELIQLHLADSRKRGRALSGLWASEATIYSRFGYGVAAEGDAIEIDDANSLSVSPGRDLDAIEWMDEAAARALLPAIYARATRDRPGVLRRSELWWRERRFLEAPFVRAGASLRRHVAARRGGELVGYVSYRQRGKFERGRPAGSTDIVELIGIDARAEITLWKFCLGMDLFPTVQWWNAPTDDVLPWIVSDRRRVRQRRTDTLWLRIDDVASALAARSYFSDGAIRIGVDGASWELEVEAGRARCAPTDRSPDLVLGKPALGSLYLGGISASRLARAGLVDGNDAAVAAADRIFASQVTPWCPEVF